MISSTTRIAEQMPPSDVTELIAELRAINEYGRVTNMLRSMSVRPNLLRAIWQTLCMPGYDRLTHAQHDLIAQYVAAQTHSAATSGPHVEDDISPEEHMLLEFVGELLQQPYFIADQHLRRLQEAGWTDTQIAEAVYDANLFQLLGRIGDTFPSGGAAPRERASALVA